MVHILTATAINLKNYNIIDCPGKLRKPGMEFQIRQLNAFSKEKDTDMSLPRYIERDLDDYKDKVLSMVVACIFSMIRSKEGRL